MIEREIELMVNGSRARVLVKPQDLLVDVLRDQLGLIGTKKGCGTGECGACTVLLDGRPVNACLILALRAQGKEILTIEGLGTPENLHPLQESFIEHGAVQCGFCAPGMLLAAKALLDQIPHPTEPEIRQSIAGNICRCTGYTKIVQAIEAVGDLTDLVHLSRFPSNPSPAPSPYDIQENNRGPVGAPLVGARSGVWVPGQGDHEGRPYSFRGEAGGVMSHVIGQRIPRHDALLQVTGKLEYGVDLTRRGMLHARVLRSQLPHAKITRLDTSRARKLAGVAAVITAEDIPNNRFGFTHLDQPLLAEDKVRYHGDAVAVVAAESLETAEQAVQLIEVEYEELPGVFDPLKAMEPDAPRVHGDSNIASHLKIRFGDIDLGWARSDHIVEDTITTQMIEHAHIEPHAALAEPDPRGMLTVYSSVQRPFLIAADLSKILKMPLNRIRVVATAVGGGFGGKNEITMEPYISLLALKTGKPVKIVYTREEEFQATTIRHPYIAYFKSGVKKNGTLVARQIKVISDAGAYVSWGESTLHKACIHGAGPYRIPHVKIDGYLVYTNNNIGGAMRGFGVPQLGFAHECHTDNIAEKLGMDPLEFRLKNLMVNGSSLPTGQVLDHVSVRETLRQAVDLIGWKKEVVWDDQAG